MTWQLPTLPKVPKYWRFTPGEWVPSFPDAGVVHDPGLRVDLGAYPLGAGAHQQRRIPGGVGQELLQALESGRRLPPGGKA